MTVSEGAEEAGAGAGGVVWLVRHGATEWSTSGQHTSRTDLPLTEDGEREARALGERLGRTSFDLVLSSPRQRAARTAELAGFPDVAVDPDLVEWDYGEYEGLTTAQIREHVPGWDVWTHPSPGGETAAQVTERLDRAVARLRGRPGRSLVFGHSHALRALTARWLEQPVSHGRFLLLNTATVSVLGSYREDPVILRWNCATPPST